jgi:hypothetical protein
MGIDNELPSSHYGQGILELKILISGCPSTGCLLAGTNLVIEINGLTNRYSTRDLSQIGVSAEINTIDIEGYTLDKSNKKVADDSGLSLDPKLD